MNLQGHFGFLFRTAVEGNDARHKRIRQDAPCDASTGNLKHNVESSLVFLAVWVPGIRKLGIIDSSYALQRCDKFWKIFYTRPLLIGALDRNFHHDRSSCSVERRRRRLRLL